MTKSHGYAAFDKTSPLRPYDFEHRDPAPDDVVVDIDFCGICHSDIHQVRDEFNAPLIHADVEAINAAETKPSGAPPEDMNSEPRFEVMISTVLRKSTVRP